MSVNRSRPHVLVLPEDDANSRLANGFHLQLHHSQLRSMQVLPAARGWTKVLDCFKSVHVKAMARYPERTMVLLIDFDRDQGRLAHARGFIPENLKDRVFVLGVWTEPEELTGSLEAVGQALAADCQEETGETWGHELLRNNRSELERLREIVRPILFPG